jgi:hypothetical protein
MPLKEIANVDRTITITPTGLAIWTPALAPVYDEHPSNKTDAPPGKDILLSRISWTIAAGAGQCTLAGYNFMGGATNNPISPSATKVRDIQHPMWAGSPLCKGDKGNCMGVFQKVFPPDVKNCTCDFEITDAGQTKAKAQ